MARVQKTEALRERLEDTMTLLNDVAEPFWSSKIRTALVGAIDPAEVLSWFGGMGSFNDLFVAAVNGHQVRREHETTVNKRLDVLRTEIHELAKELL
jgi:hypothetical protein